MRQTSVTQPRRPFRRLRWKMTLSYTVVTVGALMVLELAIIAGALLVATRFFRSPLLADAIERSYVQPMVDVTRPYLVPGHVDVTGLQAAVAAYREDHLTGSSGGIAPALTPSETEQVFVVGSDGTVLAVAGTRFTAALGAPYQDLAPEAVRPLVAAALDAQPLGDRHALLGDELAIVTPVFDEEEPGAPLGAVGVMLPVPTLSGGIIADLLPLIGVSLAFFTLGTGLIGTLFGFLTSRSLVKRLDRISTAADDWSRGDFGTFIQDASGDELTALAQRMNRMAEQLQNLVGERNRLAVLQERNRIARDLHDSAKQQAFAAAGQIGAARALLTRDAQAAEAHLAEADELIYALRQELSLLIEELRPAALEEKGLGPALRDYAERWSRRIGIAATVEVTCDVPLSIESEQTLFRIAQEALANVARHSRATHARIALACGDGRLALTVADDGAGFDPQQITSGFGLSSIRQRAASLPAGTLTLHSAPGKGTTVEVTAELAHLETEGGTP